MDTFDMMYDGQLLSDFGFVIGSIDSSDGSFTMSDESTIVFDTVSTHSGKNFMLTNTKYETALTATFTIVKNPCKNDDLEITDLEYRRIMRWLNREQFLECGFAFPNQSETAYYNASFNVEKNRVGGRLVGLDLTMITDSPHAHRATVSKTFTISSSSTVNEIEDVSDVIGYTYPDMKITIKSAGDLTIANQTTGYNTIIKGCTANEVITIKGKEMIISSSNSSHDIPSNFNFEFFALQNTYSATKTKFTCSLPCTIEISYKPSIKSGV